MLEVNEAPVLDAIGSQDVTRPGTLEFTVSALDADVIDKEPDTLTFSLGTGAPAGAIINSATDVFSWTPTGQQVGSHNITVTVTDGTDASDSEEVAVTVAEGGTNEPPVLDDIVPQDVDELETLSFTANATDGDNDTLEFSLVDAPAGALINMTTGLFSWTPTEQQDGIHVITVQVDDGNRGIDSGNATMTVLEVNEAPVLDAIGSQDVTRPGTLEFTVSALDADVIDKEPDTLTFSLGTGAPAGAIINSATDVFSWTPTGQQVGSHNITVTVTDGTDASDSEEVAVTVAEGGTNEPPVLDDIVPQDVDELETLSFTANATDGDNDTLEFSLVDAPAGALINMTTGLFSWTPTEQQDGIHVITVQVDDGNRGIDSGNATMTVLEVNEAPVLDAIGSQDVTRPGTLEFTVSALDADVIDKEPDTLTFSLGTGARQAQS